MTGLESFGDSQESSCEGKKKFDTYSLADGVLKRAKCRKSGGQVYHCKYCKGYHIGSKPDFLKPSRRNPKYRDKQNEF